MSLGISRWIVSTFPMRDSTAARYAARIQRVYGTDIRHADDPLPELPIRSRRTKKAWRWLTSTK